MNPDNMSLAAATDLRPPSPETDVARVEVSSEAAALREDIVRLRGSVEELYAELDDERSAAATAAAEAMSMILRLQREKSEAQMESRQFRRLAEEKMAHDRHEIKALEVLLFEREQALQSLTCELQSYKHRLTSYGILAAEDYPPLSCAFPAAQDEILKLEGRISQLEMMPSSSGGSLGSIMDSSGSGFGQEFRKGEVFPITADRSSDNGGIDDMSDRVYTIDTVHCLDHLSTPMEFEGGKDEGSVEEGEIKDLYARLQALEADRDSMRQAMMSMGTDQTQIVLLKEIAQRLCEEEAPEKKLVRKPPFLGILSMLSVIVWFASHVVRRKNSNKIA